MIMYKIECEWNIGLNDLYMTQEGALNDLRKVDWKGLLDEEGTADFVIDGLTEEGLLEIKAVHVRDHD